MFCAIVAVALYGMPDVSVEDLERFPSYATACSQEQFADRCVEWLSVRADYHPDDPRRYAAWLKAARDRDRAWTLLRWAHQSKANGFEYSAEVWLHSLRDEIGFPAYYRGEMPPCVPLEFYEVK